MDKDDYFVIGFTGTQKGITPEQDKVLFQALHNLVLQCGEIWVPQLRHGDCVGADEEAHELFMFITRKVRRSIIIHPPSDSSKRAWCQHATGHEAPLPYLDRNHKIVDASDLLLVCPGEMEEQLRSGTWATYRYAKKTNVRRHIIYPDGRTRDE